MIGEINNNFFFRSSSSFSTKGYQSFLIRSELYLSPITAWFPGFSSLYDDYCTCTVSFESVWFIHHVQIGHLLLFAYNLTKRTYNIFGITVITDTTCSIAPLLGFELCSLGFKIYNLTVLEKLNTIWKRKYIEILKICISYYPTQTIKLHDEIFYD